MSPTAVGRRSTLLAVSCALLSGCWDLQLPDVGQDGGVGPDLTIETPQPNAVISLNAPVSVSAVSVNGVAAVTVTCGPAPSTGVFTWAVPPYSGVVDFTRCSTVTSGGDGGPGLLHLTFIAVDLLGHSSSRTVDVLLDTTVASLFAVLPDRVVPLAPLKLTLGSDRPLLLPPTVRLAGREADGIAQRPNPDGGAPLYDVTFLQAPGLGIDLYTGDPYAVPFEVLSDIERSVGLAVDARATNGNASHLEQGVLLSRVLWDRIVPGRIAIDAAEPVATARGVQVALAKNTASPNASSDWLPGFFRASDGTYVPFDPSQILVSSNPLPDPGDAGTTIDAGTGGDGGVPDGGSDGGSRNGGPFLQDAGTANLVATAIAIPDDGGTIPFPVDAGFVAADFDARGNVLFTRPNTSLGVGSDVIALGEPVNGPRPAIGFSVPFALDSLQTDAGVTGPPLTRMDDLLCLPDVLTGAADGCFYGAATQQIPCLRPATGTVVTGAGSSTTLELAPALPGGTAGSWGSVRTYLTPNDVGAFCGPAWAFYSLPQGTFFPQPRTDPAFAGCSQTTVTRLLPLFDGSFAVAVTLDCAGVPAYQVLQVGPDGALRGSYLAKQGLTLASPPLLLAGLADGSVVTMRNDPPYTTFEAWRPDGAGPVATARVPGLYVYGAASARLGKNVRPATDGSLSVLLNSATLGDVVLQFGPGLKPRSLFRYPRLAQSSALVGAVDQGTVYYVDPLNNDIVALKRF